MIDAWEGIMDITLNTVEVWGTIYSGALLHAENKLAGLHDRAYRKDDSVEIVQVGELAARAVAKALNLYWEPKVQAKGESDLPYNIEVRAITMPHHGLKVRPADPPSKRVVGVKILRGDETKGTYSILGWYLAGDAQQHGEWLRNPGDKVPFFRVPQEELRPMSELVRLVDFDRL